MQTSNVLGLGERAVLALATMHVDSEVLMDDAAAREEARQLKLQVRGTLGILVQAYRRNHLTLSQVEALLDEIAQSADIWISVQLCNRILELIRKAG